jgi:cyanophycin synthetase
MDFSKLKFNFRLLLQEIASRGIQLGYLGNTDIIEASLENHVEYLINYITRLTPGVYLPILDDKFYAKEFVRDKGFSVAPGNVFHPNQIKEAANYANQIEYPVVLKPTNGGHGDLVFANLKNEINFLTAFKEFAKYTNYANMLVEKHFQGDDYRFLVIADRDIAVAKRSFPSVVGDGVLSIRSLVEQENNRRMNPRTTCLCPIYIDDVEGKRALEEQNLTPETILAKNQQAILRYHANVSWGAECENVLDQVHPSYLNVAKKIHALFPGSHLTCVDLLIKNIAIPASNDNYVFCEFNSDPGFSLHHMPSKGQAHYVLKSIVDLLFPETAKNE